MVEGYAPEEEAHMAAMAAAASFYSYPMYPHMDKDVYEAQEQAAAAYRHYNMVGAMPMYDDPMAGMAAMPGPPPSRGGGGASGRERSGHKKRDASAAAVEAAPSHGQHGDGDGAGDSNSRHARSAGKGPSSSRAVAAAVGAGRGAPAPSMYDYLGAAAHLSHPYAYTMAAAGLPYNSKAYMLAAPAFAGRYGARLGVGCCANPTWP